MNSFSLGISTCPNDTFSFYAMLHKKVKHPFQFHTTLQDIEQLNTAVFTSSIDLSKVSMHAYFHCLDDYNLLCSGAALGNNCGPLLISKNDKKIKKGKIALPGEYTTASLLFRIFYGDSFEFCYMPFNQIINAVKENVVDAGVIIHESRFTYSNFGLFCLDDLGERWFSETGELIPLGGIAVNKKISPKIQFKLYKTLKSSIEYALKFPEEPHCFIAEHSIEKSTAVIQKHIALYVNRFSVELEEVGKNAISTLFMRAMERGIIKKTAINSINECFIC